MHRILAHQPQNLQPGKNVIAEKKIFSESGISAFLGDIESGPALRTIFFCRPPSGSVVVHRALKFRDGNACVSGQLETALCVFRRRFQSKVRQTLLEVRGRRCVEDGTGTSESATLRESATLPVRGVEAPQTRSR